MITKLVKNVLNNVCGKLLNKPALFSQERQGSENSSESESFQQLLNKRTMEYVEEILSPHFGGLIAFVRDCEVSKTQDL